MGWFSGWFSSNKKTKKKQKNLIGFNLYRFDDIDSTIFGKTIYLPFVPAVGTSISVDEKVYAVSRIIVDSSTNEDGDIETVGYGLIVRSVKRKTQETDNIEIKEQAEE